jgi:hypothetical protein
MLISKRQHERPGHFVAKYMSLGNNTRHYGQRNALVMVVNHHVFQQEAAAAAAAAVLTFVEEYTIRAYIE